MSADKPQPYSSSPVFDENTLPAALRTRHSTKAGVWGHIRVLEGQLKFFSLEPKGETILTPDQSGVTQPEQPHFVEVIGPVKMQIDFYHEQPIV